MFPFAQKSILTTVASFILLELSHANAEVADAVPQLGDFERWTALPLGGGIARVRLLDIYLSTGTLASLELEIF
jgi:hypothetical protein